MLNNRMKISILTGIVLGIICILGSGLRVGFRENSLYLIALFYNRVMMGIVFGLLIDRTGINLILRGAILGLIISFAFYLSTGFADTIAFFAGVVYGVIIDVAASRYKYIIENWSWL